MRILVARGVSLALHLAAFAAAARWASVGRPPAGVALWPIFVVLLAALLGRIGAFRSAFDDWRDGELEWREGPTRS